jgi:hypothetical protein
MMSPRQVRSSSLGLKCKYDLRCIRRMVFIGSQGMTFSKLGVEVLTNAWNGYNASLFACMCSVYLLLSLSLSDPSLSSQMVKLDPGKVLV